MVASNAIFHLLKYDFSSIKNTIFSKIYKNKILHIIKGLKKNDIFKEELYNK